MIAVDTNVLLRYLLEDDELQTPQATRLITGKDPVLLTDTVLVETLWTLRGKKYSLDRKTLISVIHALFEEKNIQFEDAQAVWKALSAYRAAKPVRGKQADFADALIPYKAHAVANQLNCTLKGIYTFDKAAQQLAGMRAPE